MRSSKNVKMLLCASAAAGLASFFSGQVQAQSYTYLPASASATTWAAATSWSSTAGTSFPNLAGDVANLNVSLTAPVLVDLPTTVSVGTLDLGDTSGTFQKETIGANGAGTLVLDSGAVGVPAVINESTTGTIP